MKRIELIGMEGKPVKLETVALWASILIRLRDERDKATSEGSTDYALSARQLGIARMPNQLIQLELVDRYEDAFGLNARGYVLGGGADGVLEEWLDVLDAEDIEWPELAPAA